MDFTKLSDTLRGLAAHVDAGITKGIGFAEIAGKVDGQVISFGKMIQAMLDGMAGVLEASPVTLPGPKITPPTGG